MKLFPNLVLPVDGELGVDEDSDVDSVETPAGIAGELLVKSGAWEDPSLLPPANNCFLDFRVVDVVGLLVVDVDTGGGVVLVVVVDDLEALKELRRVWNLFVRFPNFLLTELLVESGLSVDGFVSWEVLVLIIAVDVGTLGCDELPSVSDEDVRAEEAIVLVEVVVGELTEVVTITCCGVIKDLVTEVLTVGCVLDTGLDDIGGPLSFIVPCVRWLVGAEGADVGDSGGS